MSSQSETKVKKSKSSDPAAKAERKARKAASAATAAAAAANDSVEGDTGDMAIAAAEEGEPGPSTKKRRRESDVKEEDLLEINVEAPEPLSKAEARAAKKRAKLGLPEETASKDEKNKKKKKARVNADRLSDVEDEDEGEDGEGSKGKGKAKDGKDKGKGKNKDKEGKPAKPAKKNSVWIGNLSFRTTEERIKEFMEKGVQEMGGPEGSVTRINLPKKEGKAGFSDSRGFAYVDFVTPEAQALAVGLSEKVLEGRKLLIKLGDDFKANPDARTPKPATIKAGGLPKNQPHSESSTLFVGNLPFDATEEAVREMLEASAAALSQTDGGEAEEGAVEAHGEGAGETLGKRAGKKSGLRKVRLGQFEDTGRCKGFGFLDFLTPRHATSALSNRKNHFFQGRKLVLQYASAEATKRSGGEKKSLPPKTRGPKPPRTEHDGAEGSTEVTGGAAEGADIPAKSTGSSSAFGEHGQASFRGKEQRKGDQRGKKWESAGRPRPGAALAMAKREKVGIVEAQGSKITFD